MYSVDVNRKLSNNKVRKNKSQCNIRVMSASVFKRNSKVTYVQYRRKLYIKF